MGDIDFDVNSSPSKGPVNIYIIIPVYFIVFEVTPISWGEMGFLEANYIWRMLIDKVSELMNLVFDTITVPGKNSQGVFVGSHHSELVNPI